MFVIFNKLCIYDKVKNESILYIQYKNKFNHVIVDNCKIYPAFCDIDIRCECYIKIEGKIHNISLLTFYFDNDEIIEYKNIELEFPFENCNIILDKNKSAIISTFCKNYGHRLDEWIQYNIKLGFSGIVIFNNEENNKTNMNEPIDDYCIITKSMEDICSKYKDKVFIVNCPYSPFLDYHYDNIQRVTLHIGVNALMSKCKYIALIDADEFIYIPKNPTMFIEDFLENYNKTITIKSNILTNKNMDDIIDNNILQIAQYIGEDKYKKTILCTNDLTENEFIVSMHTHPKGEILEKEDIIHYHCWVNGRYEFNESMERISLI